MADRYCVLPASAVVESRQLGFEAALDRAHQQAERDGCGYVVVEMVHEVSAPLPEPRS